MDVSGVTWLSRCKTFISRICTQEAWCIVFRLFSPSDGLTNCSRPYFVLLVDMMTCQRTSKLRYCFLVEYRAKMRFKQRVHTVNWGSSEFVVTSSATDSKSHDLLLLNYHQLDLRAPLRIIR